MARDFCLLALLFSLSLADENFWFSYKIATDNNIMINEERNISPVMMYDEKERREFLCKIDAKKDSSQTSLEFLQSHYERLLQCFYKMPSRIQSDGYVEIKGVKNTNELSILPLKFTVEFKPKFANIYLLNTHKN